jgi:pimeloyl-[acyl-carrier protein] methyl ester esterase
MDPVLVLLPGMDGTGDLFAPLLTALGPEVSSVVVRYPNRLQGYGSHEEVARAALPEGRPFVVLGESFSGPVAISIAAGSPPGLRGYILCASFLSCPSLMLQLAQPLLGVWPPRRVPDFLAEYFLMGRFVSAPLRRLHAEALSNVSDETLVARLKAVANVDVREKMTHVTVPGLYLRATRDRLVSRSAATTFSLLAKNARLVDIEGPHFLLQSSPSAAARVIRKFMSEVVG